jgi:hypothetical protein
MIKYCCCKFLQQVKFFSEKLKKARVHIQAAGKIKLYSPGQVWEEKVHYAKNMFLSSC